MKLPSAPNDRSQIISGMSRFPCGSGKADSSSSVTRWKPARPCQTLAAVKPIRWSWYQSVAARWSSGYVWVRLVCPPPVSIFAMPAIADIAAMPGVVLVCSPPTGCTSSVG